MPQNNYHRIRKIGIVGTEPVFLCVSNGKSSEEPKYCVRGLESEIFADNEIVAEQKFEAYARSMHETFVSRCHLFREENKFIGEAKNDI